MKNKVLFFINRIYVVFYKCKLKKKNVVITKKSYISSDSIFEEDIYINRSVIDNCKIGKHTHLSGDDYFIDCSIGRYCSIGGGVKIVRGNHPTRTFVSTHPLFYRKGCGFVKANYFEPLKKTDGYGVVIGNDVWIGQGVTILHGVTIGDGAIVGTGAIVTKDIPAYGIAVGIPAKIIRFRFEEKQIEKLLTIQWWNKPDDWIRLHAEYFKDIDIFLDTIE